MSLVEFIFRQAESEGRQANSPTPRWPRLYEIASNANSCNLKLGLCIPQRILFKMQETQTDGSNFLTRTWFKHNFFRSSGKWENCFTIDHSTSRDTGIERIAEYVAVLTLVKTQWMRFHHLFDNEAYCLDSEKNSTSKHIEANVKLGSRQQSIVVAFPCRYCPVRSQL